MSSKCSCMTFYHIFTGRCHKIIIIIILPVNCISLATSSWIIRICLCAKHVEESNIQEQQTTDVCSECHHQIIEAFLSQQTMKCL
uniref:Uncharacterized protein n=1 Tax=Arion vulgaris TaxID=1028688 RepID=A0A0B6ZVJ9_9EUPU